MALPISLACRPAWRWAAWMAYVLSWTLALLTSAPVRMGARILSTSSLFYTAKTLHVAAYAGWAVLTAFMPVPRRLRLPLLGVLSVHALASEYLQQFVPGRHPSWRDVGLDHVGIFLGATAAWKMWRVARGSR